MGTVEQMEGALSNCNFLNPSPLSDTRIFLNLLFAVLIVIKKICHGVKQNAKYVPLVKENVMKLDVFILGGPRLLCLLCNLWRNV